MNESAPRELSPTSKRLFGLRDFAPTSPEQKLKLVKSEQRMAALAAIDTTTMPRGPKREMKRGIVLEVCKLGLLSDTILKNNLLVYLGSGTDIEYALALGGRQISMVDPIFSDESAVQDLIGRIQNLGTENINQENTTLNFNFDFGEGIEPVSVTVSPKTYSPDGVDDSYSIPESTGLVVLYASQGPEGVITVTEDMKSKIVPGGALLHDAEVIRFNEEHAEEQISLGKKFD
jgi:hypothetical protein